MAVTSPALSPSASSPSETLTPEPSVGARTCRSLASSPPGAPSVSLGSAARSSAVVAAVPGDSAGGTTSSGTLSSRAVVTSVRRACTITEVKVEVEVEVEVEAEVEAEVEVEAVKKWKWKRK